ncbi:Isotrichodermin C-15 hydroxylase [Sphaceloma murrayae]|uniref:Isotrichodermin C-15 hydroxylase n=1 Tax=Sphaceloma murrayae TaxID=2082308 RepID=A0A2K1QYG9_9PEZI|nr:Isotrichodermin C-15 hydroxylase [Sphaceloma murrayae]
MILSLQSLLALCAIGAATRYDIQRQDQVSTAISHLPASTPVTILSALPVKRVSVVDVTVSPPSISRYSFTGVSITRPTRSAFSYSYTPRCTPTIAPGKDGYLPPGTCGALWNYAPSFSAAVALTALFGVLLLIHVAQAAYYRTGYAWVVIMSVVWQTGSFASRAFGSKDQQNAGAATVSQILVLLAPLWINAFAYMVFARVVHFFAPARKVWLLSPNGLTVSFVALDIVAFVTQLVGGGMAGPDASAETRKKGIDIYMGGIGMQEGFLLAFLALVIRFHVDQTRAEKRGTLPAAKGTWRPLLYALYFCVVCITVRIIFRLVEFSGSESLDLAHKEGYFYALDTVPTLFATVAMALFHPGRYISGPEAELPPSWISRHLCCCCRRSSAKQGSSEERTAALLRSEDHELYSVRSPLEYARIRREGAPGRTRRTSKSTAVDVW